MIKQKLGFTNDYIIIFKGNTYPLKDWFKSEGAKYHAIWGWSFAAERSFYPEGITPIKLYWNDISENGDLKPEYKITEHINSLKFDPSPSAYQGTIGETLRRKLTLTKTISLQGYYDTYIYIFEDENQNIFLWSTTGKKSELVDGNTYLMRGRIKEHKRYRNCKQTIINYCRILKRL